MKPDSMAACVPLPVQIVIDDVGWWSGADGHERQEPYRTGIDRNHVVGDYEAIVRLGRSLHMRPQIGMVLSEWDRDNILRTLPTATWMGADWDNRQWVGPWLDEAAAVLGANAAHVEVALHALGHEYWTDGVFTRAEWMTAEGCMRPPDQVMAHLDCYEKLLRRNGLGDMPRSFVPTAHYHCFGEGDTGFAAILSRAGVGFISTPFRRMRQLRRPQDTLFGVEHGIMTVDRTDHINWNAVASSPTEDVAGPIVGLHWPNILHPDPVRNSEVVDRWVTHLEGVGRRPDRMLARDTNQFRVQLAYHAGTGIRCDGAGIALDFGRVGEFGAVAAGDAFTIKVACRDELSFTSRDAKVLSWSRSPESGCYTLVASPARNRSTCVIEVVRG
jgi:hypothetical protein